MIEDGTVLDQAIAWHLRLAEADESEWLAFTEWLEAAPEHAAAYDHVALTDRLLPDCPALHSAAAVRVDAGANDNHARPLGRRAWLAGASLAAAAAAVAGALLVPGAPMRAAPMIYETPDGVSRTVDMADGSRVELGGGSRLRVDVSTTRVAMLDRGEAVFHVRHDSSRPFSVTVNDVAVQDLGTVFSVARDQDAVRVAVAEGSVAVSREDRKLTLRPGDTATADAATHDLSSGRIAPGAVGGWRNGTLTFQGEPLSSVVARLNRLYALNITLAPNLSDRPFTGMVELTGDAARDVPHLAALIGTGWRHDGEGWLLSGATPSQP